ncbi:hypothetical protein AB0N89_20145 [Amycolatopsis sp. NPDC089917]|uniref:pPIWI_RE_Z domain-containing protein n=1 Tax=Amycolatopsis sp. NPDC089917 TaxID=3155187 RepID=UPI00341928A2
MRAHQKVLRSFYEELRDAGNLRLDEARLLCEVELGVYLHSKITPAEPISGAWTLFSGYPYVAARGFVKNGSMSGSLRAARFSLWTLRRKSAWTEALDTYRGFDRSVRAYAIDSQDRTATRLPTEGIADDRWTAYERLLKAAPPFAGSKISPAGDGEHRFPMGRETGYVELPDTDGLPGPAGHDLDHLPVSAGRPISVTWRKLLITAAEMDRVEPGKNWVRRLASVRLRTVRKGGLRSAKRFKIDRIQHLLGIVGAGKSTLRDVLAVHLAQRRHRVTVVVGDVAETLRLVQLYQTHLGADAAAPILGFSGKQRHAQRMHRRLTSRGDVHLLAHDDPGFTYLSTSCVLNSLRGGSATILPFSQSPCTALYPRTVRPEAKYEWSSTERACPYWHGCPRHHGAHDLVNASVWVATPAALVDATVPRPQNAERIRYLELACRRSDLVIVDEADKVQMHLDGMFAQAAPLVGGSGDRSLLDEVNTHRIRELSEGARTQLSDRDVEDWTAAINTVTAATDRLYAMLVSRQETRAWVSKGYFSAWKLQIRMVEKRYPHDDPPGATARKGLIELLEKFRDNPFGDRERPEVPELTRLVHELLTTGHQTATREKLRRQVIEMFDLHKELAERQAKFDDDESQPDPELWLSEQCRQFEFTLVLSVLEPKLAQMNWMWPRVESVLKLAFNEMYQRPADYAPLVPEAPMGNVLGFRFILDGPPRPGVQSGELRYFRCSGVGRELLRVMPGIPETDGRPGTNVLLMSGSSWAGLSSRYHIPVPVGIVLLPPEVHVDALTSGIDARVEFLQDSVSGEPLRLSGADLDDRFEILCKMVTRLGEQDHDASILDRELRGLPDARRRVLLLVGSYEEAQFVADTLHRLRPRWQGRVVRLVSDDDETVAGTMMSERHAPILRRGDIETLARTHAEILVAPLLAVERGHNILNFDGVAAIGTVYFLARPNPRPDDLGLAVHTVNDWIVRYLEDGRFQRTMEAAPTLDDGATTVLGEGRKQWFRALARSLGWSALGSDRASITWDLLVLIWQVIGRLVRGGVPARVVFVDAAFAPEHAAGRPGEETPKTSLLYSIRAVLGEYLVDPDPSKAQEKCLAKALYGPLWGALERCLSAEEPTCIL